MYERVIKHLQLIAQTVFDQSAKQFTRADDRKKAKAQRRAAHDYREAADALSTLSAKLKRNTTTKGEDHAENNSDTES